MMNYLIGIGSVVVFAAIGLVLMYLSKLWQDKRTKFDDDKEIEEKGNLAVSLRRVGLYVATALALAGASAEVNGNLLRQSGVFLLDGVVALIVLGIAYFVSSRILIPGVNNDAEVGKGNLAVGLIEVGSYIATGLVLYGSFAGEGGGVLSAVVFSLLGQIVLLVAFAIIKVWLPFNLAEEIKSGNTAAGVAVAGEMIALGIILTASIAGPFMGWYKDLSSFGVSAVLGMLLLVAMRWASDWLFLPNTTIGEEVGRDRNTAAIALVEGVTIAVAVIVASVL